MNDQVAALATKARDGIAVGDVVRLKSGGPSMTVGRIKSSSVTPWENIAECHWIDEAGGGRQYTFPLTVLRKN